MEIEGSLVTAFTRPPLLGPIQNHVPPTYVKIILLSTACISQVLPAENSTTILSVVFMLHAMGNQTTLIAVT
jgi:hypothetical protein